MTGSTRLRKLSTDEAGFSRRYGGIHFAAGDLAGRAVGRLIGRQAWDKAKELWDGRVGHQSGR